MLAAVMYFMLWFPLQILRRLWWRWDVEGVEHLPPRSEGARGMVLAVNHLNWTDIHILGASLPLRYRPSWIAKVEMFRNPLAAWWLRTMQVIPIKRGKRDIMALAAAEEALKRGAVLVIFPEGHRSDTGQLIRGRGGAVRLAVRTGCPIVPVAIWGTEHGLRGAMMRKPIHVRFGKPYHPATEGNTVSIEQIDDLVEEMMLHIAELMPEQYWGVYRERMLQLQ